MVTWIQWCKKSLVVLGIFFVFLAQMAMVGYAEESATAKEKICLNSVQGTVTVKKANQIVLKTIEGMKLYQGYQVETAKASSALISLDSKKLIQLDSNTKIQIGKQGKKLEVLVEKGTVFFDVKAKLQEDEKLNVKTSTMTMGIRGTSGTVSSTYSSQMETQISQGILFTGNAQVVFQHAHQDQTAETVALQAGYVVTGTQKKQESIQNIVLRPMKQEDSVVKPFAACCIQKSPRLQKNMKEQTGLEIQQVKPNARQAWQEEQKTQKQEQEEWEQSAVKREAEKQKIIPSDSTESKIKPSPPEDSHKKDADKQDDTSEDSQKEEKDDDSSSVTPHPDDTQTMEQKELKKKLTKYVNAYEVSQGYDIFPLDLYQGIPRNHAESVTLKAPAGQGWLKTYEDGSLNIVAMPHGENVTIENVEITIHSHRTSQTASKKISVTLLGKSPTQCEKAIFSPQSFFVENHEMYLKMPQNFDTHTQRVLWHISKNGLAWTEQALYEKTFAKEDPQSLSFVPWKDTNQWVARLGEYQEGMEVYAVVCEKKKGLPQLPHYLSALYHGKKESVEPVSLETELQRFCQSYTVTDAAIKELLLEDFLLPEANPKNSQVVVCCEVKESSQWMQENPQKNKILIQALPVNSFEIPRPVVTITVQNSFTGEKRQKDIAVTLPSQNLQTNSDLLDVQVTSVQEQGNAVLVTWSGLCPNTPYTVMYQWSDTAVCDMPEMMYGNYYEKNKGGKAEIWGGYAGNSRCSLPWPEGQTKPYLHLFVWKSTIPQQPILLAEFHKDCTAYFQGLEEELEKYKTEYQMIEEPQAGQPFSFLISAQNFLKQGKIPEQKVFASLLLPSSCRYFTNAHGILSVSALPAHGENRTISGIHFILQKDLQKLEQEVSVTLPCFYSECDAMPIVSCTKYGSHGKESMQLQVEQSDAVAWEDTFVLYTLSEEKNAMTPQTLYDAWMQGNSEVCYGTLMEPMVQTEENQSMLIVPLTGVTGKEASWYTAAVFRKRKNGGCQKAICYGKQCDGEIQEHSVSWDQVKSEEG